MSEQKKYEGWSILELMGHRRLGGYVLQEEIAGAPFLRIDVPGSADGKCAGTTQFYSPAAVYCITPTTEEIAKALAARNQPAPVHRFELPAPEPDPDPVDLDDDEDSE